MLVKVLDSQLANMIAAGEVVERPSSVAKELCENSIDAGASSVTVEIRGGGLVSLCVTDNGCGIHPDDMETAFLRHATSKISSPDDLTSIMTLGFRGEALASIGAVAKVTMVSKMESLDGKQVVMEGGKILLSQAAGCPVGTRICVENLFYNTPARMKFLKKDYTEAGYVEEVVRKLALAHPEISFRFVSDGKEKLFTPGDGALKSAAYAVYGKDVSSQMVPLEYSEGGIKITGLTGNITMYRKNRGLQSFFVNNRCIVSRILSAALEEGYKGMIPIGCFPVAILKVEVNPSAVDVNVHPAKLEVKFVEENKIYSAVYWAAKNAVSRKITPTVDAPTETVSYEEVKRPVMGNAVSEGRAYSPAPATEYIPTDKDIAELEAQQKNSQKANIGGFLEELSAYSPKEEKQAPESILPKEETDGAKKKIGDIEFVQLATEEKGSSYRIIGQLFDTYILLEEEGNLVLIDQHAAHERIIYERLLKEKTESKIVPQMLLVPEVVSLTPVEFAVAMENKAFLENIGWEIDEYGDNDIAVRGVPYVITKEQVKDTLVEIIGNLRSGKQATQTAKEDRILYTIACRSAVKGHDKLTLPEIQELVRAVKNADKTLTCPHGRPVSTVVTKGFIEKLFKRL